MKKVAFSISNVRSKSDKKMSGFGYLSEGNLLCPCISKNNKPFIRVFDDVVWNYNFSILFFGVRQTEKVGSVKGIKCRTTEYTRKHAQISQSQYSGKSRRVIA